MARFDEATPLWADFVELEPEVELVEPELPEFDPAAVEFTCAAVAVFEAVADVRGFIWPTPLADVFVDVELSVDAAEVDDESFEDAASATAPLVVLVESVSVELDAGLSLDPEVV